ncbi:MAG: thiamine pyrophosphate-binding protein, partial [Candidatus Bathyanammoxibius sp.]
EGIRFIDTRHEQAAVFMAEGWARATGKPGVAMVTAGPGVTNAVTGVWTAYENGAPIVVFGGRSEMTDFERGSLQDMNSLSMMQLITKWARAGYETKRIAEYVSMAFRHALGGRPGPAYLEFPIDVLYASVEESEVTLPQNYRTTARPQGDPSLVKEAVDLLLGAERPVVLAGGGVWWSQAAKELQEFAELTKIPVSSPVSGVGGGSIPDDHPLSGGSARADVVLTIGLRLDYTVGFGRFYGEDCRRIQVDIEPSEIGHNRPAEIGIVGDAKAVLKQMIEEARERCQGREESPWVGEVRDDLKSRRQQMETVMNSDDVPVHYARLCKEIRDFIDKDATVVLDGGDIAARGMEYIPTYHPGHFFMCGAPGTLGIGPSFAGAAKLARPDKQALLLSGDGSFGLNAMEFDTLVKHKLPVVCVVANDQAWGMIKHQREARGATLVGTELGFVRYDKVVEGLGGYGEMVERPEDIRPALERAFASGLPACINVKCSS